MSFEHGALIGCNDGVTWAASAGFTVGKNKGTVEGSGEVEIDEFANLLDAFNNNGDCKKVGGIQRKILHEQLRLRQESHVS